jgi:predicted LPLAT superfamily acyltransferase
MAQAADLLGIEEDISEAQELREEAIAVRNLEQDWMPNLGVLPGEPGWNDQVQRWAIEIQRNKEASGNNEIAGRAYLAAVLDDMPNLSMRILATHLSAIKSAALLPELLCLLAARGDASPLRMLYGDGVDPATAIADGTTPLHIAALYGHTAIVTDLLGKARDAGRVAVLIEARGDQNATALHAAAQEGHTQIVSALLDSGADILAKTKTGATALILAARGGHIEIVRLLLEKSSQ